MSLDYESLGDDLTEIELRSGANDPGWCLNDAQRDVRHLIAALRASREDVTNLENQLAAAADVIADMEGHPQVSADAAGWEPWMADLADAIENRADAPILCAHADRNGEGAHWKRQGEPCPPCGWIVGPIWKLDGETCICVLAAGHDGWHKCSCGGEWTACGRPLHQEG